MALTSLGWDLLGRASSDNSNHSEVGALGMCRGEIENIPVEEERGVSHPKSNGERPQEHHSKGEESAYRERGRICSPFRCLLSQGAETVARYTGGEGTPICSDMWS